MTSIRIMLGRLLLLIPDRHSSRVENEKSMQNFLEIGQVFWQQIQRLVQSVAIPIGETTVPLTGILQFIFYSIIIIFIAIYLRRFLRLRVLKRLAIDQGLQEVIANLFSYGTGALFLIVLLQTSGFNLSALAVIIGGLGVGIGFGLQDLTKNFASGLTLIVERKIKVGDLVEFNDLIGFVREISTRSTLIQTFDGADVVVPNSQLVENRILNWSYDNSVGRLRLPVSVAYGSDVVLVTETLLMVAYLNCNVLDDPSPIVHFDGFGDSALNFNLLVWISPIAQYPQIRSSLFFAIEYSLRQRNISIPFPQRDLWLRNPEAIFSRSLEAPVEPPSPLPEKAIAFVSLRDLFRAVPYFNGFNELEIRQLIEVGYRKSFKAGEILFQEGDKGDTFYIILSGSIEIVASKINKHLKTLKTGDFFGELALMLGIPRTATAKIVEDTILFTINQKNFEKLLRRNPDLSEAIVRELAGHREELKARQQELRERGLISNEEDDGNIIAWVRKRIQTLFNLNLG